MAEEKNLMQRLPCLTQDQRDLIRVAFLVRTGSPGPLPNVDRILLWPLGHAIDALHYLRKGGRWPQLRETLRKLKTPWNNFRGHVAPQPSRGESLERRLALPTYALKCRPAQRMF